MKKIKFNAIIEQHQNIDAAYIKFPYDTQELFGIKGQVKVKVVFDNKVEYRGSLANMGTGCHTLGIRKEIRAKINKSFGDSVSVEIEQDLEKRVVVVPDNIEKLLNKNPDAKGYFDILSFTDRKEYITWIESAKKEETKANRIDAFIDKLKRKKKLTDK
jgi:hypothetical protein